MKKTKVLVVFAVAMIAINLALIGWLFTHFPMKPLRGEGPKREIIRTLDFSDAQIVQYERLIRWHRHQIDQKDRQLIDLKNSLYQTFNQPNDHLKDSLLLEINKTQLEIEKIHYRHFKDIQNLCNKVQRQKFNAMTKRMANYFHREQRPQ